MADRQSPPFSAPSDAPRAKVHEHVSLWEEPAMGLINLRGDANDKTLRAAVETTLGVALPSQPNTWSGIAHGARISWLGPDQWQIRVADTATELAMEDLKSATNGLHVAIVDVSDATRTAWLVGPASRDVLEQGCPLDLDSALTGPHQCARSLLGATPVLLHRLADQPAYDVQYRSSSSAYVWNWLETACRNAEFVL